MAADAIEVLYSILLPITDAVDDEYVDLGPAKMFDFILYSSWFISIIFRYIYHLNDPSISSLF